jgi:hypothetical protein
MTVDELQAENWKLKSLLFHMYLHDNYRDCGFLQMTTEQKKLFVKLLEERDHVENAARLKQFIAE